MTIARPRRRHGMMLVEMLITIGVIALFLVLAGKLFTTTLRLTHASQRVAKDVALIDSCVAALRRDAWGAAEMTAIAGGGVRITQGDGAIFLWSADHDGALVRRTEGTSASDSRRWPGLGTTVTLQPDAGGGGGGGVLTVRAGEVELRLLSQVALAGGREP